MIEVAPERAPHPDDPVRWAIRPGQALVARQQAPQQERARVPGATNGGHGQMPAADPAQLPVIELKPAPLGADEPQDVALAVNRHQRWQIRVGPRGVDQGSRQEPLVVSPTGVVALQEGAHDMQVGALERPNPRHAIKLPSGRVRPDTVHR